MTTARRTNSLPVRDSKIPASGEYRMVQPRKRAIQMQAVQVPPKSEPVSRRRISGEYLDMKDGPIAIPVPTKSAPVRSVKPKVIELEALDDAFDDTFEEEDAADAPDSLVQMMEGLEGTRVVKEEAAWPKEMPAVPRAPSVPKMEAINPPPGPLQPPISRMTPRPLSESSIIEEFAKFGPAPTSIWQTPGYAFHVRERKKQLKQELGLHRERRASDVALYEKSLRHVDDEAVRRGYMVMAGAAALGVLVIVIICVLL